MAGAPKQSAVAAVVVVSSVWKLSSAPSGGNGSPMYDTRSMTRSKSRLSCNGKMLNTFQFIRSSAVENKQCQM